MVELIGCDIACLLLQDCSGDRGLLQEQVNGSPRPHKDHATFKFGNAIFAHIRE